MAICRKSLCVTQFYETEAVEKLFCFECDQYNFLEVIMPAPKQAKLYKISCHDWSRNYKTTIIISQRPSIKSRKVKNNLLNGRNCLAKATGLQLNSIVMNTASSSQYITSPYHLKASPAISHIHSITTQAARSSGSLKTTFHTKIDRNLFTFDRSSIRFNRSDQSH
ncbi:hypothetical protein OAK65_01665 [Synechococcus sp. AH-551-N17]|nr:hypothetical protein [Synechococcus sp. AH-551-N17]